jgi:hypothetical protein
MSIGVFIGYAVAFLVGLILGRVWGGASARRGGQMLTQRAAYTPPLASTPSPFNVAASAPADATFEEEVRRIADSGNLIHAIKLYRERTGCGLKEAKDAVERIRGR